MKEITVKEFLELVKGGVYQVESVDSWNIYIAMEHVTFTYDDTMEELTFLSGTSERVTSEISFKLDAIDSITHDEESEEFNIEFRLNISNVTIRKAVQ